MAANLFQPALSRATDSNGDPISGALLSFYLTGTNTPATFYTNGAGTVAGSNPHAANAAGVFAPVFLDPDITYRVVLQDTDGNVIWDIDPVRGYDESQLSSDAALVALLAPQVADDAAQVAADKVTTENARDDALAAIASGVADFYPGARSNIPQGATGHGTITGGSGGTDGTFALAFTGGNFDVNPTGTFTVSGGAVTAITITGPGLYIGGAITAPTLDFSASTGLTGASASLTTGFLVASGEFYYTDHASDADQVARFQNVGGTATEVEGSVAWLNIAQARAYGQQALDAVSQINDFEVVGLTGTPVAGVTVSSRTRAYANPVTQDCTLTTIRVYSTGSGNLTIRRLTRSGNDMTMVGSATTVAVSAGLNTLSVNIPFLAGEYVGFFNDAGTLNATAAAGSPYFQDAGTSNLDNFTDDFSETSVRFELGFDFSYPVVTTDGFRQAEADIDALQGTASKLANSFETTTATIFERSNTTFFAAGTFTHWATSLKCGEDVPANLPINALRVRLQYETGATKLFVKRSYRSVDTDLAPGQASDVAIDELEFSLASLGLAADTQGEVLLDMGDQATPDGRVLIYEFRVTDDALTAYNIGFGRSDPTGLSQRERGFYKQEGSGSLWTSIGGTAALQIAALSEVYDAGDTASAAVPALYEPNGNTGATGYLGRAELPFDNSTAKTFRLLMPVPAYFDSVQVILGHGGTVPVSVGGCAVKAVASTANVSDTSGFTRAFFDGQVTGEIPAAVGSKGVGLLVSDPVAISSVAPSGGTMPLVLIDVYLTTASLTLMGKSDGTTDRTAWATHPEYPWISRYNNGDCTITPANFTSTTNRSTSPIAGVVFTARGQVVSVVSTGDSLSNGEGSGITYPGASFGFEACRALNSLGGVCYSHLNLAWSSSVSETFRRRLQSAYDAGLRFSACFTQAFSPNDIAGSTVTDANIAAMKGYLGDQLRMMDEKGTLPIIWTGLPNGLVDYTTTDVKRQDFNDVLRGYASRGNQVLDFDLIARSGPDGNGRYTFKAGFSSDTIHPDDSGILEEAALAETGVANLGLARTGALVTA